MIILDRMLIKASVRFFVSSISDIMFMRVCSIWSYLAAALNLLFVRLRAYGFSDYISDLGWCDHHGY